MHRIARNALIDHYRRPRPPVAVPEALTTETADAIEASRGALAECLRPLVMHLDPLSREALLATALGGKSQVEAAREVGITVSTMKSRIQRGRQKLRDAVLQCCHVELDRRSGVIDFSPRQAGSKSAGTCCGAACSSPPQRASCTATVGQRVQRDGHVCRSGDAER
jgi:RNA polymerase sigma-70 factor (ECF subfamily)